MNEGSIHLALHICLYMAN